VPSRIDNINKTGSLRENRHAGFEPDFIPEYFPGLSYIQQLKLIRGRATDKQSHAGKILKLDFVVTGGWRGGFSIIDFAFTACNPIGLPVSGTTRAIVDDLNYKTRNIREFGGKARGFCD